MTSSIGNIDWSLTLDKVERAVWDVDRINCGQSPVVCPRVGRLRLAVAIVFCCQINSTLSLPRHLSLSNHYAQHINIAEI